MFHLEFSKGDAGDSPAVGGNPAVGGSPAVEGSPVAGDSPVGTAGEDIEELQRAGHTDRTRFEEDNLEEDQDGERQWAGLLVHTHFEEDTGPDAAAGGSPAAVAGSLAGIEGIAVEGARSFHRAEVEYEDTRD